MSALKKGDKIVVLKSHYESALHDRQGVVVAVNADEVLCSFHDWDGHDGAGGGETMWYLRLDDLQLAPEKKPSKATQAYKGNGKHTWELVVDEAADNVRTSRLRVPGGWLYLVYDKNTDEFTTTLVPMPEVVKHAI